MTSVVDNYGFFEDAGFPFLLESGRNSCYVPGLENLASPFSLYNRTRSVCPHTLQPPKAGDILEHRMVEVMAPGLQEAGVYYARSSQQGSLRAMNGMVGGNQIRIYQPWFSSSQLQDIGRQLRLTNAAPIVFFYDTLRFSVAQKLIDLPRHRNLILCGDLRPTGIEELPDYEGDRRLPWRDIGAAYLERYIHTCMSR